jgi:hypothetical protein
MLMRYNGMYEDVHQNNILINIQDVLA